MQRAFRRHFQESHNGNLNSWRRKATATVRKTATRNIFIFFLVICWLGKCSPQPPCSGPSRTRGRRRPSLSALIRVPPAQTAPPLRRTWGSCRWKLREQPWKCTRRWVWNYARTVWDQALLICSVLQTLELVGSFSLDEINVGGSDDILGDLPDKVPVAGQSNYLHRVSGHTLERLKVGASNMPVSFLKNISWSKRSFLATIVILFYSILCTTATKTCQ